MRASVLHVVGALNPGGIETWLLHTLRLMDRDEIRFDFLVHSDTPGYYDAEVLSLGSRIHRCPYTKQPWRYATEFRRILRNEGPYDIVHSHVHHYSGFVMRLAAKCGVTTRITHSHSDITTRDAQAGQARLAYLRAMKRWIGIYATRGIAASRTAGEALFGDTWDTDSRWQIQHCGIDLRRFRDAVDSVAVRKELSIPPDAFVIGHVGQFREQKNHKYLLEIAAQVSKKNGNAHLLLIGNGPLRASIQAYAAELGLINKVTFTGARSDVPRLMRGAMDRFVFPSHYEGLGLSLIEAQAAGLPSIVSDRVPNEADVVAPLISRMSLSKQSSEWSDVILQTGLEERVTPQEALIMVERSQFNVVGSTASLRRLYLETNHRFGSSVNSHRAANISH